MQKQITLVTPGHVVSTTIDDSKYLILNDPEAKRPRAIPAVRIDTCCLVQLSRLLIVEDLGDSLLTRTWSK